MKKLLLAVAFLAFMTGVIFAPIIPVAGPSCKPTSATAGMIGCWPQVNPSTITSSDYFDVWQPGPFPASANLVSIYGLFAAPPPIGTSATPAIGWLQAIGVSDLLTHTATVTLEFPSFAAFAAYKPSVITTALAWLGAPVVAHTTGYFNAGDGGSATYNWNRTSAAAADNLFIITPGGSAGGRWFLEILSGGTDVRALGVVVDGVTSADVALSAAVAACTTYGTKLFVPPGGLLLNGTSSATGVLSNCTMSGVGVQAAVNTNILGGSTILLTSATVKPFTCQSGWGITGITFYWPGQTTGTTVYKPLLSDNGVIECKHGYLDRVTIVNAYDGLVQSPSGGPGMGDVNISNSSLYAVHDLLNLNTVGATLVSNGNEYSPGPWLTYCNFTCSAAVNTALQNNVILHASAGATVNVTMEGGFAEAWRYGILVDGGATVGESKFDISWDGMGTLIDASAAGAVYAIQNIFRGQNSFCAQAVFSGPSPVSSHPCFNMGSGSGLFLQGFMSGSQGTFAKLSGGTLIIQNSDICCIGAVADGVDYYLVQVTGGTPVITVQNNPSLSGVPSNIHSHGIVTGANVPLTFTAQNNSFINFNEAMNIQSASNQPTMITGNVSQSTTGAKSVIIAGTNPVIHANNGWDKQPLSTLGACGGAGAVINGAFSGYIQVGSTNPTTSCAFTMPWVPYGLGGGACQFSLGGVGPAIGGSGIGAPPVVTVTTASDVHSSQIYFNCPGQQ